MRTLSPLSLLAAAGLLLAGCVSSEVVRDTRQPEVIVDSLGNIFIHDRPVPLASLAHQAKSASFEPKEVIRIQMPEPQDRLLRDRILIELRKSGYTRVVFTTERKAFSRTNDANNPLPPPAP